MAPAVATTMWFTKAFPKSGRYKTGVRPAHFRPDRGIPCFASMLDRVWMCVCRGYVSPVRRRLDFPGRVVCDEGGGAFATYEVSCVNACPSKARFSMDLMRFWSDLSMWNRYGIATVVATGILVILGYLLGWLT